MPRSTRPEGAQRPPTHRSLAGRIAAHESWAATPDRTARTAPARQAFIGRFEAEARERYPDLADEKLAQVAESLRKAYYARLAKASAEARAARKSGQAA